MGDAAVRDAPTTGVPANTYGQLWSIVTHPAFRLGFRDAQGGRPLDHDRIADRIRAETPPRALERLGFGGHLFREDIAVAQYRYEEGRLLHIDVGLRCKAWGHPDYPPAAVQRYIETRAAEAHRVQS